MGEGTRETIEGKGRRDEVSVGSHTFPIGKSDDRATMHGKEVRERPLVGQAASTENNSKLEVTVAIVW